MLERYKASRALLGWAVTDIWTGKPVVFRRGVVWAVGLDKERAESFARFLNRRAKSGIRKILQ